MFTGYHGTNRDFDAFDESFLGSRADGHSNGLLGIWVAVDRELAERFGERVLAVEVDDRNSKDMSISDLHGIDNTYWRSTCDLLTCDEFYRKERQKLLDRGVEMLRIIEKDGSCHMAIIVDLEAIRNVYDVNPSPRLA